MKDESRDHSPNFIFCASSIENEMSTILIKFFTKATFLITTMWLAHRSLTMDLFMQVVIIAHCALHMVLNAMHIWFLVDALTKNNKIRWEHKIKYSSQIIIFDKCKLIFGGILNIN
jgi:hypothetical protein